MQREGELPKSDDNCPKKIQLKEFTCDECGRTFHGPILTTVSTGSQRQTFYACPRCMTKIQNFRPPPKEIEGTPPTTVEPKKLKPELEGEPKCEHFFGYLNKRQKDTPFPDECLMCLRMVECMYH